MHLDQAGGTFKLAVLKIDVVLRNPDLKSLLLIIRVSGKFGLQFGKTILSVLNPVSYTHLTLPTIYSV